MRDSGRQERETAGYLRHLPVQWNGMETQCSEEYGCPEVEPEPNFQGR